MPTTTAVPVTGPQTLPPARRPFVLGLFTPSPRLPLDTGAFRFDPVRQIGVLADGTPRADAPGDERSRTTGGLNSPTELEIDGTASDGLPL
ncbi:putative ATP-grasp-modified RiPP [Streptomyces sp. NBC_01803]|uniref:putative ATP-grasp-modified RiPP n=1 Tax=Streptomyces sp. NBC_01803 TaxID=2975946 RepID=UPI002DDA1D71|nr:putative ATP-grasp-modified RiPP [Streptomyces sp. NBC_01803]WSA43047.1 putative ATP-grasp-modified RiPP [Streptomyces sp. NBC_01803]